MRFVYQFNKRTWLDGPVSESGAWSIPGCNFSRVERTAVVDSPVSVCNGWHH